jgi:CheY-like chemotaxis protein
MCRLTGAMAGELDFDLLVLDLNLPGLNGVSILRFLRARKPSRPILVRTGRTQVEDRVQCLDLGADDYLGKPFSVIVSCLGQEDTESLDALSYGAFDYVPKYLPNSPADLIKIKEDLIAKIKAAACAKVSPALKRPARVVEAAAKWAISQCRHPLLPADLPVGVLVVQHMPPGFTGPFARRSPSSRQ